MGVIGKLFGRKNEPAESNQPSAKIGDSTSDQGAAALPALSYPDDAYGLKFIKDNGEARIFTSLPVTIGRAPENDLVLADDTVSAHHARVYYDDTARTICIEDLGSLNGIAIQNLPTRKNILQDGAKILLGNVALTFRDTGYLHPGP
jgi:pSer/pThr/pTyr-binding forkhead associated (FHA) protein